MLRGRLIDSRHSAASSSRRQAPRYRETKVDRRFPQKRPFIVAVGNVRFTSILLKKSEIEVPRKSRFRALSVVSTRNRHSRA
jgi:hypothetical protein